jgi:hypothetical protein
MKYQANPVIVDAYKITNVGPVDDHDGSRWIDTLEGDIATGFLATREMTSRITPQVGDYVVVQSDGYTYLNPKDVFERKYSPTAFGAIAGS